MRLDGVVVGDQNSQAAIGDPVEQLRITPIERSAKLIQHRRIRITVHLEQLLGKAGMQADHVAGLDDDAIGFEYAHHQVVADGDALVAHVCLQVDHDPASLNAGFGHVLNAQLDRVGSGLMLARTGVAGVRTVGGSDDVLTSPVTVVIHRLRNTVAVGVEHRPYVREAVPLRRILQVHDHEIIADHIALRLIVGKQPVVHVGPSVAQRRSDHRRVATRIEHVATGVIQRQAKTEGATLANLGNTLTHLFRSQQINLAALVVGAKIAPVRPWRTLRPPLVGTHQRTST